MIPLFSYVVVNGTTNERLVKHSKMIKGIQYICFGNTPMCFLPADTVTLVREKAEISQIELNKVSEDILINSSIEVGEQLELGNQLSNLFRAQKELYSSKDTEAVLEVF